MTRAVGMSCGVEGLAWSLHARRQWARRSACPGRDLDRVWYQSVPADYPPARDGAWARYHADGDVVLLLNSDDTPAERAERVVVTVIKLTDRPRDEQQYVREQVER